MNNNKNLIAILVSLCALFSNSVHASIDQAINKGFEPVANAISDIVFVSVMINGAEAPLIVMLLAACGIFFTVYLGFINFRGFRHALKIVRGDFTDKQAPGEVTHFQALTFKHSLLLYLAQLVLAMSRLLQ